MNKLIYIILLVFISNCTLNKVVKHHGVHSLAIKQKELIISSANKNDIIELLGPPSSVGYFDNDLWIYIERKIGKGSLLTLGKKKTFVNNVLILEVDNKGLLAKKEFLDINMMQNMKFSENYTKQSYTKNTFVYNFLSSLRSKINDPLGKRKK